MTVAYGLGSVRQRKDGRWEWRSPARLDGKRRSVFAKSERAARTAGRRWMLTDDGRASLAVRPDATVQTPDRTLAEAVDAYLAYATDRVRRVTAAQYQSLLRTHVVPARGHIPLLRLTTEHLQTLYEDMRAADVTLSTLQATHIALRQVTKFSVAEKWIPADPMADLRPPGGSRRARVKASDALRYWTAEEFQRCSRRPMPS